MAEDISKQVAALIRERDLFARHLGMQLLDLRPGYSRAVMTIAPYMVNGLGSTHGAAVFALADYAFSAACNAHGRMAVALSMDIHFINATAPGTQLTAEAHEIHCGERVGLYHITVVDQNNLLIAELHGMAYRKSSHLVLKEAT